MSKQGPLGCQNRAGWGDKTGPPKTKNKIKQGDFRFLEVSNEGAVGCQMGARGADKTKQIGVTKLIAAM